MSALRDLPAIARYHIVLIAVLATICFGWILTGERPVSLAVLCGVDWFLINLLNRITDVPEDRDNGIRGTELVARRRGAFFALYAVVLALSFAWTAARAPALLGLRVLVQAIGAAYSCRILPTPFGLRRLKDLYFLKNFASALLFGLTCFGYPLRLYSGTMSPGATAMLLLFFIPFEMTYEILYDLRDLEGDRRAGVPTFPVVHGPAAARRIIDALLVASAAALLTGIAAGVLGLREGLMLVAPLSQFFFYRPRLRRGLTARDCILLTHLGSAQFALFLIGTWAWIRLGLPPNIYL